MTYFPVKARSELVYPTKSWEGGVCDTTFRFQVASCASNRPALSPTRGSGLGGVADMLPPAVEVEWAHPATAARPRRSETDRSDGRAMTDSLRFRRRVGTTGPPASSPCGQSR